MKEIDDFGFSFEDEPAEKAPHYFDEYHRAVISFLSKLSSNPEKETVKWPNRSEEIKKFSDHLTAIYEKDQRGNK